MVQTDRTPCVRNVLVWTGLFDLPGVTDRLNRLLTVLRENRMGAAFLVLLSGSMVFALGVVGIIAMSRIAEEDPTDKPPARFTDWSTATASTKFFDAVYLADRADLASPLLADADELHEGVRKFFAADPGPKIFWICQGESPCRCCILEPCDH